MEVKIAKKYLIEAKSKFEFYERINTFLYVVTMLELEKRLEQEYRFSFDMKRIVEEINSDVNKITSFLNKNKQQTFQKFNIPKDIFIDLLESVNTNVYNTYLFATTFMYN